MKAKFILLLPLLLFCAAANANHGDESDAAHSTGTLAQLRDLLGDGFAQPRFLEVDEAFQLRIEGVAPDRLQTTFAIADGYYLYRDKIEFRGEHGVRLTAAPLPPGEIKADPYFGEIAVFKHDFSAPVAVTQTQAVAAPTIRVHATYQGCAEDGICYSPVTKTFSVALPALIPAARADTGGQSTSAPTASSATASASSATASALSTVSPSILLGALLAGLLLTFTPCVLPMLPILSGVIAGQGRDITRLRGMALALAYVFGTLVTYAAIGALAGATGEQLQAYFQNPWALGIFALVLTAMALSLFGFFTLQTPGFLQAGWQNKSRRLGGSLPWVFVLGAVSALIVGACVSPVLISFLGLAVSTGDAWLGAWMMSAMALGMGVPLLAVGAGAGHLLPKAGRWMETVNHIFGVMLIGVAIYLLGNLPEVPVLLLWGAFLVIISVYLGATRRAGDGGWQKLRKGVGVVLLIWGAAALIGGFFGERNLFRPLPAPAGFFAGDPLQRGDETRASAVFIRVSDLHELEQQFLRAAGENKLVLVDYYADWCVDCTQMERTTFRDPGVREILTSHFIALQVDVTDPRNENGKALKKRFGVFGPPAVLLFDRGGAELTDKHFYGYRNPADFRALLSAVIQ